MEDSPAFRKILTDQFHLAGLPKDLHEIALSKIWDEVFDAGDYVMFCENILELDDIDEEREVVFPDMPYILASKVDIAAKKDVFLVDHMWMTTFPQSRSQLLGSKDLQVRIQSMIGVEEGADFDILWSKLWPHLICFPPEPDAAASSCDYIKWFMMDEVGTSIQHSSNPNLNCVPIRVPFNSKQKEVFTLSLVWSNDDIAEGEILTRDYLPASIILPNIQGGIEEEEEKEDTSPEYLYRRRLRSLRSLAYIDDQETFKSTLEDWKTRYNERNSEVGVKSSENSKTNSELIVDQSISASWEPAIALIREVKASKRPLKVFCDRLDHINASMIKDTAKFVLVNNADDADVLYLIDHTYEDSASGRNDLEYNKMNKMMNQFWWEGMLVTKDQLCNTVRSAYSLNVTNYLKQHQHPAGENRNVFPSWYPITYDLANESELWMFIHDFNSRSTISNKEEEVKSSNSKNNNSSSGGGGREVQEKKQEDNKDNIWIMKRYQGKQSMDYPITSNLSCALRHLDPCPRLASKYVSKPGLLSKKKFDLRFYVIVKSFEPLVVFRHKFFVIRWSNQDYSASDFEEYQKHFTVMNFLDDSELGHVRGFGKRRDIHRDEFIPLFNSEYSERFATRGGASGRGGAEASGGGDSTKAAADNYDVWGSIVIPRVNQMFIDVFNSVKKAYSTGAAHPSGKYIHPNAAWSLHQPNATTSRAMYGFDVLLNDELDPVLMEVQWAPDCNKAVELNPNFWDQMLGALYLDEETNVDKVC